MLIEIYYSNQTIYFQNGVQFVRKLFFSHLYNHFCSNFFFSSSFSHKLLLFQTHHFSLSTLPSPLY